MAGPPLWDDPELADIFAGEPELRELARSLRAARPDPVLGPHFQAYLRARLMDAAQTRRRSFWRRLGWAPPAFAWGGAALGAAMIAAVLVTTVVYHPNDRVENIAYASQIDGRANVDPSDVIRISFSQPMDHAAVVKGLHIQPATAYTTSWQDDTLVIVPQHHLTANTPYTVSVPRGQARTADGKVAASDVQITFGTHPASPSPSPAPGPPTLTLRPLGQVGVDARVLLTPDGALVVTDGAWNPPGTSTETPSLPSLANPLGPFTQSPSASSSLALVRIGSDGTSSRIGDAATAAALSPDGRYVAYSVPNGAAADVRVVAVDGSQPATLTTTADPSSPLAWDGDSSRPTVIFTGGGLLRSVDLQGHVRTAGAHHPVASHPVVVLAPDGRHAFLGPVSGQSTATSGSSTSASSTTSAPASSTTVSASTDGIVLDLRTGDSHPLPGSSSGLVAFSGDGTRVAWVDSRQSPFVLEVAATAGGDATAVPVPGAGANANVGDITLDGDGGRAAYVLRQGSSSELRVVSIPSGDVVATAGGPAGHPVLSAAGDAIAAVVSATGGTQVALAQVTPTGPTPTPSPTVPSDAISFLTGLVDAQTGAPGARDLGSLAIQSLSDKLVELTPRHLSRGYVIHSELVSGSSSAVTAHIRLIRDPSKKEATQVLDEDVTIDRAAPGSPYQVVSVSATKLQQESAGPHVIRVDNLTAGATALLRVALDSDLQADTVTSAIRVLDAHGKPLAATITYNAETRTAEIVATGTPATLEVSTGLLDVDGQPLATTYTASFKD